MALNLNQTGTDTQTTGSTYDPHGWIQSETDANGKIQHTAYNAYGQTTDSLGNKTSYQYDVRGNLIQLTDANGNSHSFRYDRNDQLIKETLPLGQITDYQYDAAGNLSQRTTPNGNQTTYRYDASDWLIEIKQTDTNQQPQRSTSLTWDAAHNLTQWTDTDLTRSTGQQTSSGTATYDDDNRKTQETISYPNPQGTAYSLSYRYHYNLAGDKTQLTWADGTTLDYGYSQHGQLQSVTIPNEGILSISQYRWTAPGNIILPGGAVQTKIYDGLLNLEKLDVKTVNQQPQLTLTNQYSKRQELLSQSRIDTQANSTTTHNADYSYDDQSRLIKIVTNTGSFLSNATETFTLDGVSNRTAYSQRLGDWTYDANNRLTETGLLLNKTHYSYDNAGNLTDKTQGSTSTHYQYDSQNRLIEVQDSNGNPIARYGYDPFDRRLWKERYRNKSGQALAQAQRSYYLFADEGLIAESQQAITVNADQSITANTNPNITDQYGPKPNSPFGTGTLFIKTQNSNHADTIAYYHHNHLDTPIQASDKQGHIVWSANYHAFGKANINTPSATAAQPTINSDLRLPGQIEDSETGLHYNWRRYYDPDTGRYLTADPIGLAGGVNLYAYVNGNPVNAIDPMGLFETENCSQKQKTGIENACSLVQGKANIGGVGEPVSGVLGQTTFNCKSPPALKKECGVNNHKGIIYLPNAFDKKSCGPLASTIGHEISHSPPFNFNEDNAFIFEYGLFGERPGNPASFRDAYKNLPEYMYLNYEDFYNNIYLW